MAQNFKILIKLETFIQYRIVWKIPLKWFLLNMIEVNFKYVLLCFLQIEVFFSTEVLQKTKYFLATTSSQPRPTYFD